MTNRLREMQMHIRMREQEGGHGLGLMRREIVRDDGNRATLRLTGNDLCEGIDPHDEHDREPQSRIPSANEDAGVVQH